MLGRLGAERAVDLSNTGVPNIICALNFSSNDPNKVHEYSVRI